MSFIQGLPSFLNFTPLKIVALQDEINSLRRVVVYLRNNVEMNMLRNIMNETSDTDKVLKSLHFLGIEYDANPPREAFDDEEWQNKWDKKDKILERGREFSRKLKMKNRISRIRKKLIVFYNKKIKNSFIFVADAKKTIGLKTSSLATIKRQCRMHGIKLYRELQGCYRVVNKGSCYAIKKTNLPKLQELFKVEYSCEWCGETFRRDTIVRKFCSKKCRDKQARHNHKTKISFKKDNGAKYNKKIKECSVECLLEEFGDIE